VLSSLFAGVGASNPATLLAVSVLLGAVGLAAFYVPARRAMRVDPVDALREE
jgi:ABC-type antimicrobial peptide transport system permease subunit